MDHATVPHRYSEVLDLQLLFMKALVASAAAVVLGCGGRGYGSITCNKLNCTVSSFFSYPHTYLLYYVLTSLFVRRISMITIALGQGWAECSLRPFGTKKMGERVQSRGL